MFGNRSIPVLIFSLMLLSLLPVQAEAIDLEGSTSRVTVRADIEIANDGMIILKFKVLWGESEFEDSDIYIPRAHPPGLSWDDLHWDNLSALIEPLVTIEYLFSSQMGSGRTFVTTPEYFVETVLDIDVSFVLESVEQTILPEFDTLIIRADLKPDESSYTISPLSFLSKIDFNGFPPNGEVVIETDPSIDLQASSFALNHFLLPEGHRFKSEALFGLESSSVTYDTEDDSLHVRKLSPVISSTLLYFIFLGAAFLSMSIVSVAARRAKRQVNKGFEMWIGIGLVCLIASFPFHLYLSLLLIAAGFYRSLQKSKSLKPSAASRSTSESTDEKDQAAEISAGTGMSGDAKPVPGAGPASLTQNDLRSIIPPPRSFAPSDGTALDEEQHESPLFRNMSDPQNSEPHSGTGPIGFSPSGQPGAPDQPSSLPEDLQPRSILDKIGGEKPPTEIEKKDQ